MTIRTLPSLAVLLLFAPVPPANGVPLDGDPKCEDDSVLADGPCPLWEARVDDAYGDGFNRPPRVLALPRGGIVVVGTIERETSTDAAKTDITVARFDASGATRWNMAYDGPHHGLDMARAAGLSPDGRRVFVLGDSAGANPFSTELVALGVSASDGGIVWKTRMHDGVFTSAAGLAVDPDGDRVYVAGSVGVEGAEKDMVVAALDADSGGIVWSMAFKDALDGFDQARSLTLSADGQRLVVVGDTLPEVGFRRFLAVGVDPATGSPRWVTRFDLGGSGTAFASATDADGRVFVTGFHNRNDQRFPVTFALDGSRGTPLWGVEGEGEADTNGWTTAVVIDPDGSSVYVAGTRSRESSVGEFFTTGHQDQLVMAFDAATGARRWKHVADGKAHFADVAHAIAVGPRGNRVYVSGFAFSAGFEYLTTAFDGRDGNVRWTATTQRLRGDDTPAIESADVNVIERLAMGGVSDTFVGSDIQVAGPAGRVLVTTLTATVDDFEYTTAAYED